MEELDRECPTTGSVVNSTDEWPCHSIDFLKQLRFDGQVYLPWEEVDAEVYRERLLLVYNGKLIDGLSFSNSRFREWFGQEFSDLVLNNVGRDISLAAYQAGFRDHAECMTDMFTVGVITHDTGICFLKEVILYLALFVIGSVILVKFCLAAFFLVFVAPTYGIQPGQTIKDVKPEVAKDRRVLSRAAGGEVIRLRRASDSETSSTVLPGKDNTLHTLVMVSCYSESYSSLKNTLQAIAESDFPNSHHTIFIVADGKVKGEGQSRCTYEYVLDLMDLDDRFPLGPKDEPHSYNYVAVASGKKRKNLAQVYVGRYRSDVPEQRVPIILVVKTGTPDEPLDMKPGNRGKVRGDFLTHSHHC